MAAKKQNSSVQPEPQAEKPQNKLVPSRLTARFSEIELKVCDSLTLNLIDAKGKDFFSKAENVSTAKELVFDIGQYLAIMEKSHPDHAAVAVQKRNLKDLEAWLTKFAQ